MCRLRRATAPEQVLHEKTKETNRASSSSFEGECHHRHRNISDCKDRVGGVTVQGKDVENLPVSRYHFLVLSKRGHS